MRSSDLIHIIITRYHYHDGGDSMIQSKLIGEVIKARRQLKGMSQEVLSGLAGLDRTHYSKIERGLRSPTVDTLFRIAHALNISPHELIIDIENAVQTENNKKEL